VVGDLGAACHGDGETAESLGGIWGAELAVRPQRRYNVTVMRNGRITPNSESFQRDPDAVPTCLDILKTRLSNLVPVKGVQVPVLSQAFAANMIDRMPQFHRFKVQRVL